MVVKLRRRGALKEKHVQGIVHLVAGSVEGLSPENITVVDIDGNVLSVGASDESKLTGLTGNQQEFQREFEESLEKRVSEALDQICNRHPGERVAIVTHKIPIALMRCRARNWPRSRFWELLPENATWTVFIWQKPGYLREVEKGGAS